ncbi:aminotransferase class I/II-fold pyridoxal phosphate-dependent enzyme [Micromonospora endophytica]|uniref:aminotransferase class I/II-fold pyridoxal phosphate-dependent enzyme n=1 Tax=Micromonospora endophytica TaxID=515350 RepID=UPI0026866F34
MGYPDVGVLPELVEAARTRLAADGVPPAEVTLTGGALDGIERLLGAHLRPGDAVAVEDPGWASLLDLIAALGLRPVGVPVDDDGPLVAGVAAALAAGARALIVTSRAQNPTGAAVSADRAAALRTLLTGYADLLLIEDDHAAELARVPLHPLAGATTHWALLRSVSKPYGPDLRLAVLAGDETTVARVAGRSRVGAGWVSTVLQRLVLSLWRDPTVTALVDRAAESYERRRNGLLAALAERGLPGLTLRAVAERAGCTTGMVLHTFADKQALLMHARELLHQRTGQRADAAQADAATFRDALRAVLLQAASPTEEKREEARVWVGFLAAALADPVLAQRHRAYHLRFVARVRDLVAAARPDWSPADCAAAATGLVALVEGLNALATVDPDTYSEQTQRTAIDTALRVTVPDS